MQDSDQVLQTLCQSMDFTPVPLLISRVNSSASEAATGPRQQFFLNTSELQALAQYKSGQKRWFIVTVELYSPL